MLEYPDFLRSVAEGAQSQTGVKELTVEEVFFFVLVMDNVVKQTLPENEGWSVSPPILCCSINATTQLPE